MATASSAPPFTSTTTDLLDEMLVRPLTASCSSSAARQACRPLVASVSGIGSNGEPFNPQAISVSELYRASFAVNGRIPSRC
jgi:hypothetical protein